MAVTMNGVTYATHIEVLNGLFGKHYKAYQRAECKLGNGYSVWFPVVSRTTNKNSPAVQTADNEWVNLLINNDTEIHQYWPNQSHAPRQRLANEKRITFAKFFSGGTYWYKFIGVFEKDPNQTTQDHTVYKRIATQYP